MIFQNFIFHIFYKIYTFNLHTHYLPLFHEIHVKIFVNFKTLSAVLFP